MPHSLSVEFSQLSEGAAKMSNTLTTDNMGDELEKIAKPSKNHPTWSVVQGSVGRAMPEWKDVPPRPSLLESPIDYFRRFFLYGLAVFDL